MFSRILCFREFFGASTFCHHVIYPSASFPLLLSKWLFLRVRQKSGCHRQRSLNGLIILEQESLSTNQVLDNLRILKTKYWVLGIFSSSL